MSASCMASIDVAEPGGGELDAHVVHVEAELPGGELLALFGFVRVALSRGLERSPRHGARHADDAVVLGDDHVTRVDERAAANHRHVHRAERLLDRALRVDRAAPHRKAHVAEGPYVPAATVDDEPAHAARLE